MSRIFIHEVTQEDMKKSIIFLKRKLYDVRGNFIKEDVLTIQLSNLCGRILERDIGKRIYKVDGVYQIENDYQFNKRVAMK